jgi:hypothetical protein
VWQYAVHKELSVSEVCWTTYYGVEWKPYLEWKPVYCWVGRMHKKWSWTNFRYLTSIFFEELAKSTKNFSQDCPCPQQNKKCALTENNFEVLVLESLSFVPLLHDHGSQQG